MKKFNLPKAVRIMLARNTYYATVSIAGHIAKIEIIAADYARARIEAECICDDCGDLIDLAEA